MASRKLRSILSIPSSQPSYYSATTSGEVFCLFWNSEASSLSLISQKSTFETDIPFQTDRIIATSGNETGTFTIVLANSRSGNLWFYNAKITNDTLSLDLSPMSFPRGDPPKWVEHLKKSQRYNLSNIWRNKNRISCYGVF